jgi:DNA-directed RNA polymerase specialized sigma24 family protein
LKRFTSAGRDPAGANGAGAFLFRFAPNVDIERRRRRRRRRDGGGDALKTRWV